MLSRFLKIFQVTIVRGHWLKSRSDRTTLGANTLAANS